MADSLESSGGQGPSAQTDLLSDPHRLESDIKLVGRAVREGWAVTRDVKNALIDRLRGIVAKTECTVMTKVGPVQLDGPADSNANAAARVIVAMDAMNQADDHLADKNKRLDEGKATEAIEYLAPAIHQLPLPDHLKTRSLPPPREA